MLGWLDGKIANWWMPDDVVFVDEIPHTATGKIKKIELRKQFADYALPDMSEQHSFSTGKRSMHIIASRIK